MVNQAFGHSILNKEITSHVQPLLDVYETDSTIVASLDLPGVEKKDVEVSVSNGFLTISGERKNISGESGEGRIWQETSHSVHLNGLSSLLKPWLRIKLKHSLRMVF
jgi:HSP20 family molecular chaperone IbpA